MDARTDARAKTADRLTVAAIAMALALCLWMLLAENGPFDAAFGRFAPLYWTMLVAWIAAIVLILRRRRRWWVLATAPPMIVPAAGAGLLLESCLRGICL